MRCWGLVMSHRESAQMLELGSSGWNKGFMEDRQPAQARDSTSPSKEGPQHPQPRPARKGWWPSPQALCTTDFRLIELRFAAEPTRAMLMFP